MQVELSRVVKHLQALILDVKGHVRRAHAVRRVDFGEDEADEGVDDDECQEKQERGPPPRAEGRLQRLRHCKMTR